jgi:hypothetical protein
MRRTVICTAILSIASTVLALTASGWAPQAHSPGEQKLENARVRVSEIDYAPGIPRPRYVRPTDQVIVFLDDCRYERIDSQTGAKEIRQHKAGDAIWHNKGEDAPVLTNQGSKPYRTLVIEVK